MSGPTCMPGLRKPLAKKASPKSLISLRWSKIEKTHEERYKKLLENVKGGVVFIGSDVSVWKCRNCGHIVIGKYAPLKCPVCGHPQSFFELKATNY